MDDHHDVGQQSVPHPAVARYRRPAAVVAVAAYAWWTAGLRPFTWPSVVAVLAGGAAAMALGSRWRRAPGGPGPVPGRAGLAAWAVLAAALAGWEVLAWSRQPRAEHPTLSSLANDLLDGHPARALALAAWLAVAADLARR